LPLYNNIHKTKTQIFYKDRFILKIFNKKYASIILGGIFLFFILKDIDLKLAFSELKNVNYLFFLIMTPIYFGSFVFRTLRWKIILPPKNSTKEIKEISFFSYLETIFRGWFMNSVIPARGGEVYRAVFFSKKEKISKAKIFASIVLERVFDGLILFLILFSMITFVFAGKKFQGVAFAAGGVFSGIFIFLLAGAKFYKHSSIQNKLSNPDFSHKIKNDFLNKTLIKTAESLHSFLGGLDVFHDPKALFKTLFLTFGVWFCESITTFLLIKSFGYSIGITGALLLLSVVAFASLIPGGPAGLGPVQWAYIVVLKNFNISQEAAFAVSIIGQLFSIGIIAICCLYFVLKKEKKNN